jgi:hypothetical protein
MIPRPTCGELADSVFQFARGGTSTTGIRGASTASDAGGGSGVGLCSANLECQQTSCMIGTCSVPACGELEGAKTTLSGTIYDPAGKEPLYYAAVYIPNKALDPITEGVSCETADVVLSKDDVSMVPYAVALGRNRLTT